MGFGLKVGFSSIEARSLDRKTGNRAFDLHASDARLQERFATVRPVNPQIVSE